MSIKPTDTVTLAYLLLLALSFHRCDGTDSLSKSSTQSLRGLFALTVVLHHLSTRAYIGLTFPVFSYVGFISVAVFFFLSGYGLTTRFSVSGKAYLTTLMKRRIPRLIAIYLAATIIYYLAFLLMGYNMTVAYALRSFIGGSPIALNSWYIPALIILYLVFCLVFLLLGQKKSLALGATGALTLCYILIMHRLGYDYHWYMSTPGFVAGACWAGYKQRLEDAVGKHWPPAFVLTSAVFAVAYGLSAMTQIAPVPGLSLGSRLASCALFPLVIAVAAMKVRLDNRLLRFLGSISLELYLFHGLVYTFLRSEVVYIQNAALWVWLSLILSIAVAFVMNRVFSKIHVQPRPQSNR